MLLESHLYIEKIKLLINNTNIIKLNRYNDNKSNIVLYFDINKLSVIITTDFDKFCLIESDNIKNNKKFNLTMIIKEKTPKNIINELLTNYTVI
jgi:hypothetical protein